jgi:hypothetical protein
VNAVSGPLATLPITSVSPAHEAHGHARRSASSGTKCSAPSSHFRAKSTPTGCKSTNRIRVYSKKTPKKQAKMKKFTKANFFACI